MIFVLTLTLWVNGHMQVFIKVSPSISECVKQSHVILKHVSEDMDAFHISCKPKELIK